MQLQKQFFPALLLGASYLLAVHGPLRAETLQEAVQVTLQSHPSIQTAKTGSNIAAQEKREQFSGYFPQVAIAGQGGRVYQDNATSRGFTTTRGAAYSNYWEGSLTARQMLYDGFETRNRVDSARARIKSADLNALDVEERVAFGVVQAYIDTLRARAGLTMLKAHAEKVADYESRIKTMVDDGAANEAEYQQARDIRVILENMTVEYEGQLRAAEAYYTELTGTIPTGEMDIPVLHAELIPEDVNEAVADAKKNHPALRSASFMTRSAAFDAKAEKGALYPDIDGELSYFESEKADVIGGEVTDGRAVVRVNWDLETGGAQLARIEQKRLKEKETASRAQELERQIERAIRLAYSEYKTALAQADTQERRYSLNEKLFETYKVQFDGARITLLQLMQSDNQLFTTELEKMNGKFRLLAARYAILAGMGRLKESLNISVAQAAPSLAGPLADEKK
jgi:adhesin transport system outer membrane protein